MAKQKHTQVKPTTVQTEKPKTTANAGGKTTATKTFAKSYNFHYEGLLSVIIPIENSDFQLLLGELQRFAQAWKLPQEVLLVNAGLEANAFAALENELMAIKTENTDYRLIESKAKNRGQAIKAAVAQLRGQHVLLADGNFGTSLVQLAQWAQDAGEASLPNDKIWLGSRRTVGAKTTGLGSLPFVYNIGVKFFTSLNLKDTQGHFMLMPTAFAQHIYKGAANASETEILYLADLYELPIEEKAIEWQRPEGQKSGIGEIAKKKLGLFGARFIGRIRFFLLNPWQEMGNKSLLTQKESPLFRFAFAAGSIFLFFLMCMLSFDYGITGDEVLQKNYGDDVLAYFESGGRNKKCLEWELLAYYGGLFDYLAAWCNKYIGGIDTYDMRHLLNAMFGFITISYAARVGRAVSGSWRVGLLTLFFLAISPRLMGDSMNNPKDIPFAAGYIISVFYLIQLVKQLPRPSIKNIIMLILGIGLTINVRSGGIILFPYVGMFMAAMVIFRPDLRPILFKFQVQKIAGLALIFVVVIAMGYWAGTWFWPYAQQDILKNPFIALGEMTKYSVGIRMLWEGKSLWSDELPWYYIPQWLIMSSPTVILVGFPLLFSIFFSPKHKKNWLLFGMAIFTGVFPVAYAIYQKSSLYDGMRHFLFVYPMLVVGAAYGWIILVDFFKGRVVGIVAMAAIVGLSILPLRWMIVSHPHQYVYFNELFGGIKKAYGMYETDYWMNSMRNLSEWLIENEPKIKKGEDVYVATNCVAPVEYYLSKYPNVKLRYVRYHERIKTDYDYLITYSRFLNNGFMKNNAWPPGDVVYVEKADGVPLGCVTRTKDRNMKGFEAEAALKAKDYAKGLGLLEQVVQEDPKNESAWMGLAQAYPYTQQYDKMKNALDQVLGMADDYVNAIGMLGVYYLNVNKQDSAVAAFEKTIKYNYKYTFGYFHLANLAVQKDKNYQKALEYCLKFDEYGGQPAQGYDLAVSIAQNLKDRKLELYFQAKKLAATNQHNEAFKLLGQVLGIDSKFEPAIKMKKSYEDAQKAQKIKEENQKYKQQQGLKK